MPGSEGNSSPLADPSKAHLYGNGNGNGNGPYLSNSSSRTGSETSFHRVKNLPGYTTPVFKGMRA